MGKPWADIPIMLHYPQNPKRTQSGLRYCDLYFVLRASFDRASKSQKWSNMTKYLPELGQGPTPTIKKEYGGLSSTRLGKGEGDERLERGAKPKGLITREY
jgi:hypothetical protein